VARRYIEKGEFVGLLSVVHLCDFNGIAGIDVIDVIHTFDDSAFVDV
jgi:hypothetical protein